MYGKFDRHPFLSTGTELTKLTPPIDIYLGDGTNPLDQNAEPVLSGIKLDVVPKEKVNINTFAPVPKPITPVEEKQNGTTILTPLKKLS